MPNRVLRDWTDSETVDNLSVHAERFLIRLIMKVDDYGRYSANMKILKSTLFPLKTDIRETDITLWLTECEKCGLVALYNVASKEYVQINNFKQTLRQKTQKYPPPLDATQTLSICLADAIPERKGKETEKKREEVFPQSALVVTREEVATPTIEKVEEVFLANGGTKEMAIKFFNTHSATNWHLRGTPIKDFSFLVYNFIQAWKGFNKDTEKKNIVNWM